MGQGFSRSRGFGGGKKGGRKSFSVVTFVATKRKKKKGVKERRKKMGQRGGKDHVGDTVRGVKSRAPGDA